MWDIITNLASLELMFKLDDDDDITYESIEEECMQLCAKLPDTFAPRELQWLSVKNISNACRNISLARGDLVSHLGGLFHPQQDDMLCQWVIDGTGYSNGR